MKKPTIAVLGAGSWGTAIAIHLAKHQYPVMLWSYDSKHVRSMIEVRCNLSYLPGIYFPETLTPVDSLKECVSDAFVVIIAVPSHAFSTVLSLLDKPVHGLAWLTKGLDPQSHQLLSQLVEDRWGESFPVAIISGPSFATEVANSYPTALTVASNNLNYQQSIQTLLHHNNLRVYLSSDIIGVQICAAVKNVLAIACGVSDGLKLGANAKAALITRGLAEMRRLTLSLGGTIETCMGLAGVGDLVLTCSDNQSRNRRFGLQLGAGRDSLQAKKDIGQVVEGKHNAAEVCNLALGLNIDMPICFMVNSLLQAKITAYDALVSLMDRAPRSE